MSEEKPDFETVLEKKIPFCVRDIVGGFKQAVKKDLMDPVIAKTKNEDYKRYEEQMVEKYPFFSNTYPGLFDMLILNPYETSVLDMMLEQISVTNIDNVHYNTKRVMDELVVLKNKKRK